MISAKCPECSGDLMQDLVDKVTVCITCGLILKREKFVKISAPISLEKDRKTIIKIKNTFSSIKIPEFLQNWRGANRVWGIKNRVPYFDLIRLGEALEVPWTALERSAALFKKYIELNILPDPFEVHYVEGLLIACIVVVSMEIGRDKSKMIQELEYYVHLDKEEIKKATDILLESTDSGF